jgi:membrane protein YqaA with SNARE-associated domain
MHAMQTPELQTFIEASKAKGASDEFLAALLTRRGWPADDVYAALGSYWESATGLAVPARGSTGESARDAFLYLLSFSTLATWAMALGSILFQLINRWLPDAVSRGNIYYDFRSQVTWQMASMLVAFPIYLLATRAIAREAEEHPERLQSGVRKWLTYIALLIAAVAMIGDLICFLDYFLMGELTARFALKVLTVLAISGSIFAYYIGWVRRNRARGLAFGIPAAVAVVATFCIGLAVAGTPSQQRQLEADRARVQDLRNLATAIKTAHDSGPGIPATLEELRLRRQDVRITDPGTGWPYEYRLQGGSTYELCANFAAGSSENTFWSHGKGRECFQVDAAKTAPW